MPFQLGFGELILIFIAALLVFGPKKLPELGKSLGKGLREFTKAKDELKSKWEEELKDVERSTEEVKHTFEEAKTGLDMTTPEEPPKPAESPGQEVNRDAHPN
jgi:TatA/E family protein of Tat protein translocase